jgi:Tol biopolymer transport system component
MALIAQRGKLLAVVATAIVLVSAAVVFGVADSASPPESGPAVDAHADHTGIYVVDVADGKIRRPSNHEDAREPTWSARGQIAFSTMTCDECVSQLSQMDPGGTTEVLISATVKHVFQPSWAPDGHRIAAVGLGRGIYAVDPATGTSKRLTTDPSDEAPDWSPAGEWIAFHRQVRGTNYDLFVVNATTRELRRLTNDTKQQTNAAYSPDGKQIAFAEQQASGKWAVITMNTDGTRRRHVTDTETSAQEPAWSPDGKKIAFILQELDRATLAITDATGTGTPRRLTDKALFPSKPAWSPDGKSIAFAASLDAETPTN